MLAKVKSIRGACYNSTALRRFLKNLRRSGMHSYAYREIIGFRIKLKI